MRRSHIQVTLSGDESSLSAQLSLLSHIKWQQGHTQRRVEVTGHVTDAVLAALHGLHGCVERSGAHEWTWC